jgi:hypothetical protein
MMKKAKVATQGKKKQPGDRGRDDERLQILLYMKPDVIRALKVAAIEEGCTAFELTERAVKEYLARKKQRRGSSKTGANS